MTNRTEHGPNEDGFSLLEVVVALTVVSLAALAVVDVLGQGVRATGADEARTLAAIVADNRLAEVMAGTAPPAVGETSGVDHQLSRSWAWEMNVGPSPQPRILRIDVVVREAGERQVLAELSSFRSPQ